jgi:flagellin
MRVQHNIPSMNSYRNYNNNTSMLSKNLEKLSSGYQINRAGDNAAGLAISEKMRAQITGLEVAQKNCKDGISLVQTAEGALTEVHSMLNRMYEIAEQSANGTYDDEVDRTQLNKELTQLKDEIDRISQTANFNGKTLFEAGSGVEFKEGVTEAGYFNSITLPSGAGEDGDSVKLTVEYTGSDSADVTLKVGDTSYTGEFAKDATSVTLKDSEDNQVTMSLNDAGVTGFNAAVAASGGAIAETEIGSYKAGSDGFALAIGEVQTTAEGSSLGANKMEVNTFDISVEALGLTDTDITTAEGAESSLAAIKTAINSISDVRGYYGAIQNRLEHTINNLSVMQENIQDAESTIRDTDVAAEMMKYTKNSILVQSAQAMLAQANQLPQGVLQLLQ